MSSSLDVDLDRFNELMRDMVHKLRLGQDEVLRQQSRLLGNRLIAFMPPHTLAIGRRSVKQSIAAVAYTPEVKKAHSRWLKEAIIKHAKVGQEAKFLDAIKYTALGRTNPIVEPFNRSMHIFARSTKNYTPKNVVNRISLNASDIKAWTSTIQKRVGRLKAGWAPLIRFSGAEPKPAWVARHKTANTYVTTKTTGDDQFIQVRNPGIGVNRFNRHVRDAVKSRVRDMIKSIKVQLRLAKKKAGLQ